MRWIPQWNYQLIYSQSGVNETNCIFSEDISGPHFFEKPLTTTWVTTIHEPDNYRISFLLNLAGKALILLDGEDGRLSRQACIKNILFTGVPGVGKSTIIEKIVQRLDRPKTGFYTEEIRVGGRRVGFGITTLDGRQGTLAHLDIPGPIRVGRYGVNLPDIDRIAVPSMIPANDETVVIIDEIGKMECFSELFRQTLVKVMDSTNTMVGTISLKGDAFIGNLKKRPDTLLVSVNKGNRDNLVEEFFARMDNGKTSSANASD